MLDFEILFFEPPDYFFALSCIIRQNNAQAASNLRYAPILP